MYIVTIEGLPYDWLNSLQELHAHVFDGAKLAVEKLAKKEASFASWRWRMQVSSALN
ncbi:hypothetical protein AABM34_14145 [Lysinibacillus fusiformis]